LYARHRPPSPPIAELTSGIVAHLLCWEKQERDSSWRASVSWVQSTGQPVRHRHQVMCVRAETVRRIEAPSAYRDVPRRTLGMDGRTRPWTPTSPWPRRLAEPEDTKRENILAEAGYEQAYGIDEVITRMTRRRR
jgi:hypothetical protein